MSILYVPWFLPSLCTKMGHSIGTNCIVGSLHGCISQYHEPDEGPQVSNRPTPVSAFFVLLQILRRCNRIFSQNAFALVKKIQKWQMKPLAKEQASITVKADLGHWGHWLGRNWHRIRGRNGHQMSLSKPRDWATQPADFFLFMLLR